MFVRYFVELALPSEEVEALLLSAPGEWIPGLVHRAEAHGQRLLAEVGVGGDGLRVSKRVEISFGPPTRFPSKLVLPMSWTATGSESLFPSLDADVEVAPLGPERTQLSISARYVPPLRGLGRAIDRTLLHRVAEATVKDFLDRARAAIDERAAASPAAAEGM